MNILSQGCTCATCTENVFQSLQQAREKWNNGEREIIIESYHHICGDDCCSEYGTNVFVNGLQITSDGENIESVIESLMKFLEINNVNIEYTIDE